MMAEDYRRSVMSVTSLWEKVKDSVAKKKLFVGKLTLMHTQIEVYVTILNMPYKITFLILVSALLLDRSFTIARKEEKYLKEKKNIAAVFKAKDSNKCTYPNDKNI